MGATDFTWSEAKELQNLRFVIHAQKYGNDLWNKDTKKLCVAKRLVQDTVFAKRASIVHDHTSVNAAWFQSLTVSDGLKSCTMSDGRRLQPGQLRGYDDRRGKSHGRSQLRRAKICDDRSPSP